MLNDLQKQKLQDLVSLPNGLVRDYGQPNERLDMYIQQLKDTFPEHFHSTNTLKERVFMDEPKSAVLCKRYVRLRAQSPINIVPI